MVISRFSFRKKLIFSFILVGLLPVIIVQIISYYVSSEAMTRNIDDLVHANLMQTSKNLDTSILAYNDIVQQIITNDAVIELIKKINLAQKDIELSKNSLTNLIAGYSYAKKGIRSVAIFTSNGSLICYDRQTGSPYENLWTDVPNLTALPLYSKAIGQARTIITEPEKIDTINSKEQYGFHLARKLSDYNSLSIEGIGIVVLTVYESELAQAINLSDTGNGHPSSFNNRSFLVNQKGIIVSSPDKQTIGIAISDVTNSSTMQNTLLNGSTDLMIYNLIDQNELFKEMFAMRRLSVLTGTLALLITGVFIYYFSGRLSSSIRNVVRAMKVAQQGLLTVQVENSHPKDEISHIAISFNKMMGTINELIIETKQAVEKQKEAEIKALEAQINPHFLYNTLDSINWLAIEKNEHQISQMLKGLAQILRYSIKDSNKWATIQEELAWMDRYIFLQQYRFRSSFSCEIQCAEKARSCEIPKLLLQPLIENAIIHGFAGCKHGGQLLLNIDLTEDQLLVITVSDNGLGMDDAKRKAILSGLSGIGLQNVRERLDIHFGYRAKFEMTSKLGEGTSIRLLLPLTYSKGESRR